MPDGEQNDPLHGVTLSMIVERLEQRFGWAELGRKVRIKCFNVDPSLGSSLAFLRRTPWARDKVERLYLWTFHKIRRPPALREDGPTQPAPARPPRPDRAPHPGRGPKPDSRRPA